MKKHYNTILSLLEKCRTMTELKQLHGLMIKSSVINNIIPLSRVIDFCTNPETRNLDYANKVFTFIYQPSVYIWNSMIKGYTNSGNPEPAITIYKDMLHNGYIPDHFTYPFVLKACSLTTDHNHGKYIHNRVLKTGFEVNVYVSSCLLHMYVSCADMESGLKMFDVIPKWSVVGWSILISGFVCNDRNSEAIEVFKDMKNWNVDPNEITLVNVLVACARNQDIETGKSVHNLVRHLESNHDFNVVLGTALMDMYAKCGNLRKARELFDKMPERNSVAWNSMIAAYNQYGAAEEAVRLFFDMRASGFDPDKPSFLGVATGISRLGSLALGRSLHGYVSKTSVAGDVSIGTALIDMYAKTGDLKSARRLFRYLKKKDATAWTTMIVGLAVHGDGEEALKTFEKMGEDVSVIPDEITYVGVLSACKHIGLVEQGRRYFDEMRNVYNIVPIIEHYGCLVDLLSRAGRFEEAEKLVENMPMQPNVAVLSALLNGCEIYENVDLADRVRIRLADMESVGSGVYVLLSNIYAKAGKWQEVKITRELIKSCKTVKKIGCSSVEMKFPIL